MSFLPAQVDPEDARSARTASGIRLALPVAGRPGEEVVLGLRPESFRLATDHSDLTLEVDLVEPTGAETHLHGTVEGVRVVAVVQGRSAAKPGDRIGILADTSAMHVFDKTTKARLN